MRTSVRPHRALVSRALPLACVAVLVLNDHVLKARFPGFVTGKLSDFAGLLFFPLLLVDAIRLSFRREPRHALGAACAATAIVFAAVKTWGPAHEAYAVGLGLLQWPFRALAAAAAGRAVPALARVRLAMDTTDLVALLSVVAAYVFARWWSAAPSAATAAQTGSADGSISAS